MVTLQILSKIIKSHSMDIVIENQLTPEMFVDYVDEFNYIQEHYKEYGNVPDELTFLSKFPDCELVDVTESDEYLVYTLREEYLYYQSVPVVQKIAELMKTDSNAAVEYMRSATSDLQPTYRLGGTDIVQNALNRYRAFLDKRDNQENWYFTTGFPELDAIIHGLNRKEEFLLIVARLNQGKSIILEKMCTHIWEIGFNVGYISPEMGELSVGYRFDSLHKNFSSQGLMWGKKDFDEEGYRQYVEELKQHKNKFMVATPLDFNNYVTVSKLRQFIKQYKLDVLAIDGITYLADERGKRNDNKTTALGNIAEDLKLLGMELGVPILAVMQINRGGVKDKESTDAPDLDTIRDSDAPAQVATAVISLKQSSDGVITLQVKKGRGNRVGDKVSYQWNPDIGEFLPVGGSTVENNERPKKKKVEKEDVF